MVMKEKYKCEGGPFTKNWKTRKEIELYNENPNTKGFYNLVSLVGKGSDWNSHWKWNKEKNIHD